MTGFTRIVVGLWTAGCLMRGATPAFEAVSIKACGDASTDRRTGEVVPGHKAEPRGRLHLGCWTLRELIQSAYIRYAGGQDHSIFSMNSLPLGGGPDWVNYDRYTITASAAGSPGQDTMRGPMLQSLLEEKFGLKIHRETRIVPVYELTVVEGGPRLQTSEAKASSTSLNTGTTGRVIRLDAQATSLGELSRLLGATPQAGLDRPVIDKTGIAGRFDFHLTYGRDEARPSDVVRRTSGVRTVPVVVRCGGSGNCEGSSKGRDPVATEDPAAPSIVTVLRQLGLELVPTQGPAEFLFIDGVERP